MEQLDAITLTRYLLGQLPEAERERLEQACFTDKTKYYQLCDVETTLIDDYVSGQLPHREQQLFEQYFLTTPARSERVKTARALQRKLASLAPVKTTAASASLWQRLFSDASFGLPVLTTCAACFLLVLGGWFYFQNRQLRAQYSQSQATAAEQQRRAEELEKSLAATRAQNADLAEQVRQQRDVALSQRVDTSGTPLARTMLFVLNTSILRSDGNDSLRTLQLSKAITRVKFQVALPANDFATFAASLRTAEGRQIAQWHKLNARKLTNGGAQLTVELDAQRLHPGDYLMVIRGVKAGRETEELQRLPFKVGKP